VVARMLTSQIVEVVEDNGIARNSLVDLAVT
jgi:hypothetical protein